MSKISVTAKALNVFMNSAEVSMPVLISWSIVQGCRVPVIVVMMQAKAALEGNLKACEWLFDSAFGKMTARYRGLLAAEESWEHLP